MRPTPISLLATLAVLAATAGWAGVRLLDGLAGRSVQVPVSAPATLAVFALSLLMWALLARPRLQRRPGTKPLNPIVAARTAALAMAASRTGALVLGAYLGSAMGLLPRWNTGGGRDSVLASLITATCAAAVVGIALWLERLCRVRDGDDEGNGAGATGTVTGGNPEPAARAVVQDHRGRPSPG
jgi:hypothetical protein